MSNLKNEILSKLIEIVEMSSFISPEIISYAQGIGNIDDLGKFLIIINDIYQGEKSLGEGDKNRVEEISKKFYQEIISSYKNAQREIILENEQQDQEKNLEDILLGI